MSALSKYFPSFVEPNFHEHIYKWFIIQRIREAEKSMKILTNNHIKFAKQ